ncbi:DUF6879 family protein [Actinomadura rubrisoli]|uniref:DUF6879 domain-containing protein n=1 Tax=Actinomadura rubrisoli TaxID=2530368 RepID=A0A4R4ZUB5_9ACTN|nr:DUF6879 family protein [Actinomadura rubrisoli]TDD62435.1 hypothetical protein E1298_44670 [Actinomadura rubrisoli]
MIPLEEFGKLFETFQRSAFRLETLAKYTVPEEADAFRDFLAGRSKPDNWGANDWARGIVASGRIMQRVHVVRSPLSDYLRFEIGWGYPGSIDAGEDVRILDLTHNEVPGLPDHDFWLFDDETVIRMHYSPEGEFLGADRVPEVEPYRTYRDLAMGNSVPFLDYWSQHGTE